MSQRTQQFEQPTARQPGQQGQYQQGAQQYQRGGQQRQGTQPAAGGGQGADVQVTGGQSAGTRMAGGRSAGDQAIGGQATGGGGQSLLFPTQNYLPREVRVPVAETLNRVLADTTILLTHAKFAHWNVKGSDFYGLHELFDEIAEDMEEHADLVGERIAALGAQAMGTAGMAVENCSLPPMPSDAVTGMEYVEILADRLAIHDANLHDAIQTAQGYGDPDTADLLNEISREVTQQLWFLEAHLQTQPVGAAPVADSPGTGENQQAPRTSPGTQPPARPTEQPGQGYPTG